MASVIGGIGTSHIPSIANAIAKGLFDDPYWRPFFDGFTRARQWLAEVKPDTVVIFYNDHGLNFFLDKLPTFAIGAAAEYRHADEGWGIPIQPPFRGDPDLSWHLIENAVADEFDITMCQEMLVDHAFTVPMSLLYPGGGEWPVRVVPVAINTVQHPLPSPSRCYRLGQAIGRAIASHDGEARVLILGTGGLSHQLDGTRAGFINTRFDRACLDMIVDAPMALTRYSSLDLVEIAGAQGVEFLNWLAMRGALTGTVTKVHSNYHVPISNTATGLIVLENRPIQVRRRAA
jgi:protocatechuate 4,5-dioxygenase, beta chain